MAIVALVLLPIWVLVVALVPGVRHARRGGGAVARFADPPGTPQWWSRVLTAGGMLLALAAPIADLAGLPALPALDRPLLRRGGVAVMVGGPPPRWPLRRRWAGRGAPMSTPTRGPGWSPALWTRRTDAADVLRNFPRRDVSERSGLE